MALRESEATYRELFQANPQPMWVCHSGTQRFLAVNQAALRLYGFRSSEFLELSFAKIDPEGIAPKPGEGTVSSGRHRRKDGSELKVELVWQSVDFGGERAHLVLVHQAGELPCAVQLEHLVAELRNQVEAAQRELETFSYSVSHDLRAPLRHIDGFSRALLDDYGATLEPQGREYLARICQATGKMSQLIEDLQQLARVARSELNRQSVNLSVTVQVIALELKHGAPERQVEFRIQEEVSGDADPRLARQLMEILVGNAWKFSAGTLAACIEFGSEQQNGETVYFVRDNGAGFDMAYADKLFSVFHRLHRADEFEGSGVGLAIAQRIVRRHGGRIWAQSAPGLGATFYFTL